MEELRFQVLIDKDVDRKVDGVVAFGDFETEDKTGYTAIYHVDETHRLYADLIFGRPLPLTFVARKIHNFGMLLGVALFLHRDLALQPTVPGLLSSLGLSDSCGIAGHAHIDRDLSRFLRFLANYMANAKSQEVVTSGVKWLREYILEGSLPALPSEPPPPRILDRGTDGFVFASSDHENLSLGWEELYRMGFLRGLLIRPIAEDRWSVLAARKSPYLAFDLKRAATILNEAEAAMGEPQEWTTDGIWMVGPKAGL